jgi:hypothetical protein
VLIALGLAWAVAVTTGTAMLWRYQTAPSIAGTPPSRWPHESRVVAAIDRPTLLMTLHPHCPCSRASLEELDRLMASVTTRVAAHVLFIKPSQLSDAWVHTDLWRRAAAIKGVTVLRDADGIEAERFHAVTSGHTLLYGTDGRLLFSGGMTRARGHAGDNAGRSAIAALLAAEAATTDATPVFGCSLLGSADRQAGVIDRETHGVL